MDVAVNIKQERETTESDPISTLTSPILCSTIKIEANDSEAKLLVSNCESCKDPIEPRWTDLASQLATTSIKLEPMSPAPDKLKENESEASTSQRVKRSLSMCSAASEKGSKALYSGNNTPFTPPPNRGLKENDSPMQPPAQKIKQNFSPGQPPSQRIKENFSPFPPPAQRVKENFSPCPNSLQSDNENKPPYQSHSYRRGLWKNRNHRNKWKRNGFNYHNNNYYNPYYHRNGSFSRHQHYRGNFHRGWTHQKRQFGNAPIIKQEQKTERELYLIKITNTLANEAASETASESTFNDGTNSSVPSPSSVAESQSNSVSQESDSGKDNQSDSIYNEESQDGFSSTENNEEIGESSSMIGIEDEQFLILDEANSNSCEGKLSDGHVESPSSELRRTPSLPEVNNNNDENCNLLNPESANECNQFSSKSSDGAEVLRTDSEQDVDGVEILHEKDEVQVVSEIIPDDDIECILNKRKEKHLCTKCFVTKRKIKKDIDVICLGKLKSPCKKKRTIPVPLITINDSENILVE